MVGLGPVEFSELVGTKPAVFVVFGQSQCPGDGTRGIHLEVDVAWSDVPFTAAEPLADLDVELELFAHLSTERPSRVFTGLDLSTRKFPFQGSAHRSAPAGDQTATVFNNGSTDYVDGALRDST